VAETVAASGNAQLNVTGASLRIVAGAPGHATYFGEPAEPGTAPIALERLGKDEGTDANCGGTAGGSGGKKNDDLRWGCVYDGYGYCDVSCGSCTMV
jgi:hypothetical protein